MENLCNVKLIENWLFFFDLFCYKILFENCIRVVFIIIIVLINDIKLVIKL